MTNLSTDPRLNVIPTRANEYGLLNYLMPDGKNYVAGKEEFEGKALQSGWTKKRAADEWDRHCRGIIKAEDAKTEQEALKPWAEYGRDVKMSPLEADAEINSILADSKHPFHSSSHPNHERAVLGMNRLQEIKAGKTDNFGGTLLELGQKHLENQKQYASRKSSNSVSESDFYTAPLSPDSIGYGEKETKSGYGQRIEDVA